MGYNTKAGGETQFSPLDRARSFAPGEVIQANEKRCWSRGKDEAIFVALVLVEFTFNWVLEEGLWVVILQKKLQVF